ncbi:CPXCG motif-containing cysteine-rich protein [Pelagicoccus albus]|uniref:CPXCG motif-containing cysteine-rich protein n=2 Tax=Pelagicoccus albus TaxID=415222 RepID=A0A7X1EBR5_9BACT|nr:CPXCG motif-containing cysteine-rich protein [Pelagicoccus albus]
MNLELNENVPCPYCGETVGIVVDCTLGSQNFVEDCQVCCRPIEYTILIDEEGELIDLRASREDE